MILVLALLVFGPDRLPEVARNAAKFVARFREETTKSMDELKRAAQIDGLDGELRGIRDEFGKISSEVRSLKGDFTKSLDAPARTSAKPGQAPPFDPDAT